MNEPIIGGSPLSAEDAAALSKILEKYGPYANGQTALFWHLVAVIDSHRGPKSTGNSKAFIPPGVE